MRLNFLMSEEFREGGQNYRKLILRAISFGNTAGGLCGNTGLDKGMVSKYLEVLKGLRLIFEEAPVTSSGQSKNRRYFIADPYFNFPGSGIFISNKKRAGGIRGHPK